MGSSMWSEEALGVFCYLWNLIMIYLISVPCLLSQCFYTIRQPRELDEPVEDGTVAIVTGGAKGIGFAISRHLVKIGVHTIMGVRDSSLGSEAVNIIRKEFPKGKVEAIVLDLRSFESVKHFVGTFKAKRLPLHILINNAGVMLVPRNITEDGWEEHFQVNYLGHFLLTHMLLDDLKDTGRPLRHSRIVNLSSHCHYVGNIDINSINGRGVYSPHGAYAQSKLAIHLFTRCLQRHLASEEAAVSVNSVHPGVVNSDLFQHVHKVIKVLSVPIKPIYKTIQQGSITPLYVALSPNLEGRGGRYYDNCQEMAASTTTGDKTLQDELWGLSTRMCGL